MGATSGRPPKLISERKYVDDDPVHTVSDDDDDNEDDDDDDVFGDAGHRAGDAGHRMGGEARLADISNGHHTSPAFASSVIQVIYALEDHSEPEP
jgi:hypothetical protein